MAYVAIPQKRLRVKAVGDLLELSPPTTGNTAHHPTTTIAVGDGVGQNQNENDTNGKISYSL